MYAFRCSDAGEGEDLEEWSLPTLLTFELAWSPEMVRRGHEKSPHCKILSPPRQPVREYINLPGYSDGKPQRRTRRALVGSPDTRGLLVRGNGN